MNTQEKDQLLLCEMGLLSALFFCCGCLASSQRRHKASCASYAQLNVNMVEDWRTQLTDHPPHDRVRQCAL